MTGTTSPDPRKMEAAIHEYVAAFEAGSVERVIALYADDATVEDPVGSDVVAGREAIFAFYTGAMKTGAKLRLEGPVRICGDYAAFPFSVLMHWQGKDQRVDVIDTFRFNSANEVIEMRAYFGPTNMHGFS
jgi:steroid Delta-isomerase